MASKLPYNSLPNLGTLQAGDIVPVLRPPFQEGSAFVSDVQKYIRPYDVYTALISQSGTDDPTIIVLENTIGAIEWTRVEVGEYYGTLTGAFTTDKTCGFMGNSVASQDWFAWMNNGNTDINTVNIQTFDTRTYGQIDGVLYKTFIEIRVYYSEPA